MTPQIDIVPAVRLVLNDEFASEYRWQDSELLQWVNDCLSAMVDLRPDLFSVVATHQCTAGAEQTLIQPRQVRLTEVIRVVGGNAVWPCDRESLDMFSPSWYSQAGGPAVNWMPHRESPLKFYVSPPALISQQLEVAFVQKHAVVGMTDTINVSDNYAPAIQAFVIGRAESKDDEQVNSGRMAAFMADFAVMIGASKNG